MAPARKPPSHRKSPRKGTQTRTGRPLRIHEIVAQRPTGPVTLGDQIIEAIGAGNYIETAAASAGLPKQTLYDWMRRGAGLNTDLHEGRRSRFTKDEQALMRFSDAVGQALGQSEARDVTQLARLAQGGIPVVVETVKVDPDGKVVEKATRTTHTIPDAGVLEWRLERRFRDRWGRSVEVTGPEGGPLAVTVSPVEALTAELEKVAARLPGTTPNPARETPVEE